tara:strand:- start:176 stop:421 length:246 start_codon:yes stop_codon:yes gene_type:complete
VKNNKIFISETMLVLGIASEFVRCVFIPQREERQREELSTKTELEKRKNFNFDPSSDTMKNARKSNFPLFCLSYLILVDLW